ncbi:MAG: redoxin domain-containing protein [Hahellaceae bacterium]|nr:redoxin domain-containing protein [Hahellaceae bacterium]
MKQKYLWPLIVTLLSLLSTLSSAEAPPAALRVFQKSSLQDIISSLDGRPFMLVLWSIDCPPCQQELALLQTRRHDFAPKELILISTDSPQDAAAIEATLAEYQLEALDNWIFGDDLPERLRFAIDPGWYGELPRSYFYDTDRQRHSYSGLLSEAIVDKWLSYTLSVRLASNQQNSPLTSRSSETR